MLWTRVVELNAGAGREGKEAKASVGNLLDEGRGLVVDALRFDLLCRLFVVGNNALGTLRLLLCCPLLTRRQGVGWVGGW